MIESLTVSQWLLVFLSAFIIGISKTGLPGAGILAIPLLAGILPARASTGVVLPMLILADLFAVTYYHRRAAWKQLGMLMPAATVGIVLGFLIMGRIEDAQLRPAIGFIILGMLGINLWRRHRATENDLPFEGHFAVASGIGLLAGVTTMLANAAGPIMVIYLSAMQLPKRKFIGTAAWYFFVLNWVKVPFSAHLGLITRESLTLDAIALPFIAIGAGTGIFILRRIPQKWFVRTVEILAAAAAGKLLISAFLNSG